MLLRPIAFFLACFSLLNLAAGRLVPGFDANLWWIDFRRLPEPLPDVALAIAGLTLLVYAVAGALAGRYRLLLAPGMILLLAFSALNAAEFYILLARGVIMSSIWVPLSIFVLLPSALIARSISQGRRPAAAGSGAGEHRPRWPRHLGSAAVFAAMCVLFPLAQMVCFGCTDYRRPADAVVAFGARAYASGTMSTALFDRTRTAVDLYEAGLARVLIFSGGPGDGDIHETEAMRRYAMERGVPDSAILRDELGLDTQATVSNTMAMFRQRGYRRILTVSQFYHLPRIKLTYLRAGLEVYTVPAERSRYMPGMPYFIAREVAALYLYYIRPLVPGL